jgi:hypothetical protein
MIKNISNYSGSKGTKGNEGTGAVEFPYFLHFPIRQAE